MATDMARTIRTQLKGKSFDFIRIGTPQDAAKYNSKENQFLSFLCLHNGAYYGSFRHCEHLAFHLEAIDDSLAAIASAPEQAGTWVYVGDMKGRVETRSGRQAVTTTLPLAAAHQHVTHHPHADCVPAALVNLGVITAAQYDDWLAWQTSTSHLRVGTHVPIGFAIQAVRAIGQFSVRSTCRRNDVSLDGLVLVVEPKHVYAVDANRGVLFDTVNAAPLQLPMPVSSNAIDSYSGIRDWHLYEFHLNSRQPRSKRAKHLSSFGEVLEHTFKRWATRHGLSE
eukprot:TRINITY_DN1305_c0_g1_i1.p1 TRINITY_DN1305_c0_g1~~TRINITY_DN1305_c0_g1_i1.p1  ORF type:complete len:281 (+),score=33.48 TRINITY_DN1305_c0_g1_i1:209-1051(+)